MIEYKAYLRVRHLETKEIVHSVGLTDLDERRIERVMVGMIRNMGEDCYIDDSEVDAAREQEQTKAGA